MLTLWAQYDDSEGSQITNLGSAEGRIDQAVSISYNLVEGGYVGIYKEFGQGILSGIEKIGFWYKGSGASNTLEFKLIHAEEDCGGENRSAIFSVEWPTSTNTNGQWVFKEKNEDDFQYWAGTPGDPEDPPTGCTENETLDFDKVKKIDFAISSRSHYGDEAGSGTVIIDDVQAR